MPNTNVKPSQERWAYIKSLSVQPVMVHVSAEIVRHPVTGAPMVTGGTTYNIGRNAEKRAKREAKKQWKGK